MRSSQPGVVVLEFRTLKRTPRYGAKVRTGCLVCKSRRVRCDERKPVCLRCIKSGRTCSYAQDAPTSESSASLRDSPLARISNPMLVEAGDDTTHLEFYHRCTKEILSGVFVDEFWTHTTLQLASSESAVRHALITLGYLTKIKPGNLKHAKLTYTDSHKDRILVHHYNKALGALVKRMSEPSYSADVGLVACLLFICIEFFKADHHAAFLHLKSGLQILEATHTSGAKFQTSLMEMFHRTMTHALLVGLSVPDIFDVSITGTQPYPQQNFGTYSIRTPSQKDQSLKGFENVVEARAAFTPLFNATIMFTREWAQKLFLRVPVTQNALEIQQRIVLSFGSWFESFSQLNRLARLTTQDNILASALLVQYYSGYIATCVAMELDQMPYDAHLANFRAINHHARIVLHSMGRDPEGVIAQPVPLSESSRTAANFTFEVSLIPSLYYVALRCRCPATRREAVALLELNPPREGLWDAEQHAAIAKRAIEIEESSTDTETGWPSQSSRLLAAGVNGDMDDEGGFLVAFSYAKWAETHTMVFDRRRPLDSQWVERIVI